MRLRSHVTRLELILLHEVLELRPELVLAHEAVLAVLVRAGRRAASSTVAGIVGQLVLPLPLRLSVPLLPHLALVYRRVLDHQWLLLCQLVVCRRVI